MDIGGIGLKLNALLADIRDKLGQGGRYYFWGRKDDFPNVVIQAVNDSGVAKLCTDRIERFSYGRGFVNRDYANKVVNSKGQTRGQLARQAFKVMAYIPAVVMRIKYNYLGDITEVYVDQPQHYRKRRDGQFIYGEGLGDPTGHHFAYNEAKRQIIPAYNPKMTAQEIRAELASQKARYGEQLGFVHYEYVEGIGLNYKHYPVPVYASGLNDLRADAGLSVHEEAQVYNSFKAGVIIATRKLDHESKDEEGKSEYDRFTERIEEFTSPDGDSVLHIEGINEEGAPQVFPLNIQHQMDATEQATDRIARKICRLFSVPPILIGIETAGRLGSTKEVVNWLQLFNLTLEDNRELLYNAFSKVWPEETNEEVFEISDLNIFDDLPDNVVNKLDMDTLRLLFDIPSPEKNTGDKDNE